MTTATANPSAWSFISTADVTLVSAIIEPTDRSIPPEMTTIAWATAANAIGRAPIGEVLELGGAVARLDEVGDDQERRRTGRAGRASSELRRAQSRIVSARLGRCVGRASTAALMRTPPVRPSRSRRSGLGTRLDARPRRARSAARSSGIGDVGRQVVGGPQQGRLVGILDGDLGDDPAAEDDDRAVAGELDLLELGGVEEDGGARCGEVAEQLVDLPLRADVDPARRVEAEHRLGRRRRPSARW